MTPISAPGTTKKSCLLSLRFFLPPHSGACDICAVKQPAALGREIRVFVPRLLPTSFGRLTSTT